LKLKRIGGRNDGPRGIIRHAAAEEWIRRYDEKQQVWIRQQCAGNPELITSEPEPATGRRPIRRIHRGPPPGSGSARIIQPAGLASRSNRSGAPVFEVLAGRQCRPRPTAPAPKADERNRRTT